MQPTSNTTKINNHLPPLKNKEKKVEVLKPETKHVNSFFTRLWKQSRDAMPLILRELNTISTMRLVSRELYHNLSSVLINSSHSILSSKATVSFSYDDLHPEVVESLQENFDFAKSMTCLDVKLSVKHILDPAPILQELDIPVNRLELIVKINSIVEFKSFLKFIEQENKSNNINQVIGLDLEKIEINAKTLNDINALLNSKVMLKQLKKLSLGTCRNVTFDLPPLAELSSLFFGNCFGVVTINATQVTKLSTLLFADITCTDFNLLSEEMLALKTLSFGEVSILNYLKLPLILPNLKELFCKDLSVTEFIMPEKLQEVETIVIGNMSLTHDFNLSESPELKILRFGDLAWCCYNFPRVLNKLTDFSVGQFNPKLTKSKLPDSLESLVNIKDESEFIQKHLDSLNKK